MSDRGPFLLPWVSIRPKQEHDTDVWWDCECTAYDCEPTLAEAAFAANAHGRDCRKGEFRWNLYVDAKPRPQEANHV
jgi:hypothetical protein